MSDAEFRVQFAGPLVSFQDAGRRGHMRFGVPASGPMDRLAYRAALAALGATADATVIEVSMGGLQLECVSGRLSLALAGGDFQIEIGGTKLSGWVVFEIEAGQRLSIRPGKQGSWAYLAFAGDLQAERWLGHAATHSTSGFGGGQLQTGQRLRVENAQLREDRHGQIALPELRNMADPMRVVMGPQDRCFTDAILSSYRQEEFRLTDAYDRMGVRLSGPELTLSEALSIPSEPITRGSVQVSGDGVATVLLADHQTTGGYPKIATILGCDTDRLTQLRAGDALRFQPVSAEEAVAISRAYAAALDAYLAEIGEPKGTLAQRLMRENLISGYELSAETNDAAESGGSARK